VNQILWGVAVFAASLVARALLGLMFIECCPLDPAEAAPSGSGIRNHP